MFGSKPYNYESFSGQDLLKHAARAGFGSGPKPGDRAPDVELRSLYGDKIRLSDYEGVKNVVLTFGSATCPFTAAAIRGLNDLYADYEDNKDVQFLFVYVREAHPGEKIPAHQSQSDKREAAKLFREEENVEMPILVDEVDGRVHRRYGKMPNSTYVIDKSGRVAFRALWTKASVVEEALEELLNAQESRGEEHVVVHGGESRAMPMTYAILNSHRALDRGGVKAIREFREGLGRPGKIAHSAGRYVGPMVLNPGKTLAAAGLAAAVISGGLYVGWRLRKARLNRAQDPYHYGQRVEASENDYAVGI
ncbi:MAG TPA: redoxin domain-containing protein [Terriglobales bacterium]|nr:redoxin domain-containing protein [Terriglobales bacterium]